MSERPGAADRQRVGMSEPESTGETSEQALPARVGLVAGGGRFPFIVAEDLRRQGIEVVCAALRHQALPELEKVCDEFRYFGLGRLASILGYFRSHGVQEVTWAGWVRKEELFRPWRWVMHVPDLRTLHFYFFRLKDRQNQTLLAAVANELEADGFHLVHSAKYSPQLLAPEGVLSRRRPTRSQLGDIAFGWKVAKRMADLDVGQSVAVSEKSTLAVESIEGTDNNIKRAGEYYKRGGFTVVKVAKEGHDMRFDIPAIGPDTIAAIAAAGGAVLAVEAQKTLLLDLDDLLRLADRHGIVVIALSGPPDLPVE